MKLKYFLLFFIIFIPNACFASTFGLVIDEFQIAGDSAYDEYVVIANYGADKIKLDGYSLSRKSKNAVTYNTLFNKFVDFHLNPNQKIIISHEKYLGVPDFVYSTSSYSITSDNAIALIAPDKSIVDTVGFGDSISYESQALPSPGANQVYARTDGIDTDNNFNDFVLVNPLSDSTLDPNAARVIITEILPDPTEGKEWFEIYNPTNQNISLYGLKVCDLFGKTHCYSFAKDDMIYALNYKTYDQDITRITLNNDSDALEIEDSEGNVISSTGDGYEEASDGESYSLFGSEWQWTKAVTKGVQNIFISTIEVEKPKKAKTAKTKTIKTASTVQKNTLSDGEINQETQPQISEVKAAETTVDLVDGKRIGKKEIGFGIIFLALTILVGYFGYENKEKISEIYHKFRT